MSRTISVLCTNAEHPVMPHLQTWASQQRAAGHQVDVHTDKAALSGGDLLFLVSCAQVISESERARYRETFVLHASDLPRDRGWSPHIWTIVEGAREVTVCLLDARDPTDSGNIRGRVRFTLDGHELLPEINDRLFAAELALMDQAVDADGRLPSQPQDGEPGPLRPRRTPAHSALDPHQSLAAQFDLLRVVDNERYPAYFEYRGHRYVLTIQKASAFADAGAQERSE